MNDSSKLLWNKQAHKTLSPQTIHWWVRWHHIPNNYLSFQILKYLYTVKESWIFKIKSFCSKKTHKMCWFQSLPVRPRAGLFFSLDFSSISVYWRVSWGRIKGPFSHKLSGSIFCKENITFVPTNKTVPHAHCEVRNLGCENPHYLWALSPWLWHLLLWTLVPLCLL